MRLLLDSKGEMVERAVVMLAIIVAAYLAYKLLGDRIAYVVRQVASWIAQ